MKTKKLGLFGLALTLAGIALTSCGGTKTSSTDSKTIQIYAWKSGLGINWLTSIVNAYNASQTTYKAELENSTSASTILSTLTLGNSNSYDLYFSMLSNFQYYDEFMDMSPVLEGTAPGETTKIGDKYQRGFLDAMKDEKGTTRLLPYASCPAGIIYNTSMISEDELPNTTDELEGLVTDLAGKGTTPWLFYNENGGLNGYWNYVSDTWEAQYDGLDYHDNTLMQLKDASGNAPSKDVFTSQDGRYKALKVMEKILTPTVVHKQCTNTNFTTVQTLFLDGEAAMTVNGSWLMNETGSEASVNMMKTPVISSIVEKLENTKMSDATLSSIIKEIDAGATSSKSCSTNDFAKIKEARGLVYNNGSESYIFSPSYSDCQEGVIDFLKYFHSEASTLLYDETLKLPSPIKLSDSSALDTSSYSTWTKQMFNLAGDDSIPLFIPVNRSYIYKDNGLNEMARIMTAQSFIASNSDDRKNADQVWSTLVARVNEEWSDWVA